MCILTAVFSYVQPYKSRFANCLDSVLWVNAILLFLVSILEPFHTLNVHNATDHTSGCAGEQSSAYLFTDLFVVMLIFYYIPLTAIVVAVIGSITVAILRYITNRQLFMSGTIITLALCHHYYAHVHIYLYITNIYISVLYDLIDEDKECCEIRIVPALGMKENHGSE